MTNQDLNIAWHYHNGTKHSYWSVRRNAHYLDWPNRPFPFKVYPDLDPIPLPQNLPESVLPALKAISATADATGENIPDLTRLAAVLFYSAGVTKKKSYPGGEVYFRAAACAGALYPIETYIVCGDLNGLDAGVYHFNPGDFALRRLRAGDFRGALVQAAGNEPSIAAAPAVLVYTGIVWRSSWKYQARSYRYLYWDNGMVLANALAAAAANRLPAKLVMGFVDSDVNDLVGVDGEREMSLSLLSLGRTSAATPGPPADVPQLNLETIPLSSSQVEYPVISEMHAASSLRTQEEVLAWRGEPPRKDLPEPQGRLFPLEPLGEDALPGESLESVILRRASTRQFAHKPISYAQLSTILDRAARGFPADFLESTGAEINDLYINLHAVDGAPSGAYYYCRPHRALELLREGDFRNESAYLCLEQDLGGDSSATVFYLADLNRVFERFGNRGYRAAQIEAAIIGGRVYLASYSLGRGATGLTFYDDETTEFFSPHAAGKSVIFVTALGVPGKRPLY